MKLIDILFLPFIFLMSAFSFLVTAIYTFICNLFLSIYKLFTRKKEGKFMSIDDMRIKSRIGKTVVELLNKAGCLKGMSQSNQMSLFG